MHSVPVDCNFVYVGGEVRRNRTSARRLALAIGCEGESESFWRASLRLLPEVTT